MRKVFTLSFWIIMAVHFVVFMSIGLFTDRGWELLILFMSLLATTILIKWLVALYAKKHPEKKKLRKMMDIGN